MSNKHQTIHEEKDDEGTFYLKDGEQKIAEILYTIQVSSRIFINHTFVNEQYQGQGLGKILVKAVIDYAREEDFKVVPLCSYARALISKNEAWQDVL